MKPRNLESVGCLNCIILYVECGSDHCENTRWVQIVFALVDLSDKDESTPVLDFFALDSGKTRVMFLMWFILL